MWKRILAWLLGTGILSWVLRIPFRLLEDALYNWINTSIAERWQMLVSSAIGWIPPVVVAGFCAWFLIVFGMWLSRQGVSKTPKGEFHFEFNDSSVTTKDNRILLGVSYSPSDKVTIETLQLEYNYKRFRPNDWHPVEVRRLHTKNYTFDLNAIRAVADEVSQEAVFIAKVNGKEFRSLPFNIYRLL